MARNVTAARDLAMQAAREAARPVAEIGRAIEPAASSPYSGSTLPTGGALGLWGGEKFYRGIPFIGSSPLIDHSTARAEARRAFHFSTAARAMVTRFVESVVGEGLIPKPRPVATVLGITAEQAEEWSMNTAERFALWANSKQSSLAEDMTFAQQQRLVSLNAERDGEYFARCNYIAGRERISPLSINLIEQSQISGFAYTPTNGLPWTADGIERDSRGREIAYHITVQDSKGVWKTKRIPARSGNRPIILHGWSPEYAGQTRGYSPLAHALQEFSQITGFQLAHVQKAMLQSTIVLSKESQIGAELTGNSFGDISHFTPPPPVDRPGTLPADSPALDNTTYTSVETPLAFGGIGVFNNGPGEKLVGFNSTSPSDKYAEFVGAVIQNISSASGLPVEMVTLKFGANYSASRAVLSLAFRVFGIHRSELVSDFCDPVYQTWLAEEIAAGRISAHGWSDPTLRAAWLRADWNGPGMVDIDPEKSVKASRLAMEAGLTDINAEALKYNGSDAASNIATNNRIIPAIQPVPWEKKGAVSSSADENTNNADNGGN